jgi:phage terminase large subunit-like protein
MTAYDAADFGAMMRVAARMLEDEAAWDWFFRALPPPVLRRISEEFFQWQAHGGQQEPPASAGAGSGDWRVWLLMAGRNFGKTRAGAEWVSARARENSDARIALVGATRDEVAKVMIEGPSGLLAVGRSGEAPRWRPTRGVVEFASGAVAFVFSGAAPEKLRGPEHHFAWCDELAKWRQAQSAWDNLMLGLRLGARPRAIVTTTPRVGAILRRVRAEPGTIETRGGSAENVHSSAEFLRWAEAAYGGTRLGRQELDGVLLEEAEGALFPRDVLAAGQSGPLPREELKRVVVGVDPPASAEGRCGIVVCGTDAAGIAYVLADCSVSGMRPERWAGSVARACEAWGADRVVAEKNNGGDMVESVLRSVDAMLPVRLVSASVGKAARAEPVAALFEAGRAKLAGRFPELEDELAGLSAAGGYEGPSRSPDRADAMVWAMTELARPPRQPSVRRL